MNKQAHNNNGGSPEDEWSSAFKDFPIGKIPDLDSKLCQILVDNIGKIIDLAQDVFITPLDLVLLDGQCSTLGGFCRTLSIRIEDDWVEEATREIDEVLHRITPALPLAWVGMNAYFLPALTMSPEQRHQFAGLSATAKLAILLASKRTFVQDRCRCCDDESCDDHSFDFWRTSGDPLVVQEMWGRLLSEACSLDPKVVKRRTGGSRLVRKRKNENQINHATASAFWLERILYREGLRRLFIDDVNLKDLARNRLEDALGEARELAAFLSTSANDGMIRICHFGAHFGVHPSDQKETAPI